MDRQEALKIINGFQQYLKSGDETFIAPYSKTMIKMALSQTELYDRNQHWYIEMERRVNELGEKETEKQRDKKKWLDRAVSFLLGIFSTIVATAILKFFALK